MKKIAILQSNYIPWKGYFDIIAHVDEFIIYDNVQYTKNDWRNRNKIKTPQGLKWLTIPVGINIKQAINEVTLNSEWQQNHWNSIELSYSKSPYFSEVSSWLKPIYQETVYTHLSQVNRIFIEAICSYLRINTKISSSSDFMLEFGKTGRLIDLCLQVEAGEYVTGPAAKNYIDENLFHQRGIKLSWFHYDGYKEYSQLWGDFSHQVSIIDLLFNCGKESQSYMKYARK